MTTITIDIQDSATRALDALAARVAKPQALLQTLAEGIVARADARFDTQTGPDGQAWAPNSPATRRAKKGGKVLTDSGDLRHSLVAQASAAVAMVSVAQPYAAIHQFGGTIQRQARTATIRHRTDARGQLLRSAIMNGKGLVFAKASHKRALVRQVEVGAHSIHIPARPFLPVRADGSLYERERAQLEEQINAWLAG